MNEYLIISDVINELSDFIVENITDCSLDTYIHILTFSTRLMAHTSTLELKLESSDLPANSSFELNEIFPFFSLKSVCVVVRGIITLRS